MKAEEERELLEQYYRKAISGTASDEEELAIAQDLLEKAQRGFVVDDDGEKIVYASPPDLPVDADFLVDDADLRRERLRKAAPWAGAFAVALIVLLVVYGGKLRRSGHGDAPADDDGARLHPHPDADAHRHGDRDGHADVDARPRRRRRPTRRRPCRRRRSRSSRCR